MGIKWPWQKSLNPNVVNQRPIGGILTPLTSTYRQDTAYTSIDAVYTVVSFLMTKFAQVPIRVYKIKDDEALKQLKQIQKYQYRTPANFLKTKKLQKKALEQVDEDSPLAMLLQQPNPGMTSDIFFQTLYGFKLLKGEGFTWFDRESEGDKDSEVLAMHALPPQQMYLNPDRNDVYGIDNWVIQLPAYKVLPKEDVTLWRYPRFDFDSTTHIHLRGLSPLTAGARMLEGIDILDQSANANYANRGAAGIIATQTPGNDPLTQEQLSIQLRAINERINGYKNAGTIAGINAMLPQFFDLSMSSREMAYIEAQKFSLTRVAQLYNVPGGIWDLSESANNNISQYRAQVYTDKIMAEWSDLLSIYNSTLLRSFGLQGTHYIGADYSELPDLQDDFQKQLSTIKDAWELTPNERRELRGYEELDEPLMDEVWVPSSLKPIGDAGLDINQIEQDAIAGMDGSTNNTGKN